MTNLATSVHIHLQGRVQGVGFRPYVHQLALKWGLNGRVCNAADGLHLELQSSEQTAKQFLEAILQKPPAHAHITRVSFSQKPAQNFEGFAILESENNSRPQVLITPDLGICPECREELLDSNDRRAHYAFIACTHCGPRYSILQALPFDRPHTSMAGFEMCPDCVQEYKNPNDRRYFAQINSCPACGVQCKLFPGKTLEKQSLQEAVHHLMLGETVAVKGIGGYLLLCDATNADAVWLLRKRKNRAAKPFAVLYPDLDLAASDVEMSFEAAQWLEGPVAPIVLLPAKSKPATGLALEAVAPGLNKIGVMAPYAPLLALVARAFERPLVATSGNLSHAPIVFENEKAQTAFSEVADAILAHNRPIIVPQDDSVLQISPIHKTPLWLRRSRGLAPSVLMPGFEPGDRQVFAAGADVKSAFAFCTQGNVYLSQYLGDLEHYDCQKQYHLVLEHLFQLSGAQPEAVVADVHPGYHSSRMAEALAQEWQVPCIRIQHHHAHFAAVLVENGLLNCPEPVLGVIWDGAGYGTDGQIWGGEFFIQKGHSFERFSHFDYFPVLAGDNMARTPALSALSLCPEAAPLLEPMFKPAAWNIYAQLRQQTPQNFTSSVGRLFDAASAMLGFCAENRYESESAILLEQNAVMDAAPFEGNFFLPNGCIDSRLLLLKVLESIRKGIDPATIAGSWHHTLVEIVFEIARKNGARQIAFSGGVFQNSLLADLLQIRAGAHFDLYFHRQLPANDENIALGQIALYINHLNV